MASSFDYLNPPDMASARRAFHIFARLEAPALDSPLYTELCYAISEDDRILEVALQKQHGQPAPNVLLAAIQYLMLSGAPYAAHPLAAHYPIVSGAERPLRPAAPDLRDFVERYESELVKLVRTRGTQTNVVRRCSALLPMMSIAARESGQPLALIDLGASAGINLNFDRYRYEYWRGGALSAEWGDADSAVLLESEVRGGAMPELAAGIEVVSRVGVDINPIDLKDAEQLRWLQALIWPEHVGRHQLLLSAAAELERSPVTLHRGDAAVYVGPLIDVAPIDAALVVYSTIALYQFGEAGRAKVERTLRQKSRRRPIWFVTLEGSPSQVTLTRYRDGEGEREVYADASPHAWWIDWAE